MSEEKAVQFPAKWSADKCECGHDRVAHGVGGHMCYRCTCGFFLQAVEEQSMTNEELADRLDTVRETNIPSWANNSHSTLREAARRLREPGERIEGWIDSDVLPEDLRWVGFYNVKESRQVLGHTRFGLCSRATLILHPQEPEK